MSGTVQCVECSRLDLQAAPELARFGFGRCPRTTAPGQHVSATFARTCDGFAPAPDDVVEKRRAWLDRKPKRSPADNAGVNPSK